MKGSRGGLLFVAPAAYPLGGVQVWLDYLLPGLRQAGWRAALALTKGRLHDVDAYVAQHPFAPVHAVAAKTGTQQGRINALARCFASVGPDIVVGVNIADTYLATAQLRARGRTIKVAYTLHGLQPDLLADIAANRDVIDAVICTNRLAQRLVVADSGMAPDCVLYAPYGVDDERLARPQNNELLIGYVGRLENDQKRLDDLLSILQGARERGMAVRLLVAGGGPDEAWMRARVDELGLQEAVSFLGVLSAEATRQQIYARCDALIVTSLWETGPIVIWEAMSAGLPVLTSAYTGSGAENALVDGVNCLMFPVGAIERAIELLGELERPELRETLSKGGRELVLKRYTIQQSISQWDTALMTVMDRPPAPAIEPPHARASGRLDRVLGVRLGEAIRGLMGRSHQHIEPGGEWPHAYGVGAMGNEEFWATARRRDAEGLQR